MFSIFSIICFSTTDIRHKWTILDEANFLKTNVPYFENILNVWYCGFKLIIVWKMNSKNLDGIYF